MHVSQSSLWHEAGNGYNMYKAYEWIEEREKRNPGMNVPCLMKGVAGVEPDMYVPQYPLCDWFAKDGAKRDATARNTSEYLMQWAIPTASKCTMETIRLYPNCKALLSDWVRSGF